MSAGAFTGDVGEQEDNVLSDGNGIEEIASRARGIILGL
jgi:hypothetical protein